jgi:hypothetical protein
MAATTTAAITAAMKLPVRVMSTATRRLPVPLLKALPAAAAVTLIVLLLSAAPATERPMPAAPTKTTLEVPAAVAARASQALQLAGEC